MVSPLLGKHGPADRVAFGGPGDRTVSDLRRDVAALAAALPEADATSEVLLIFQGDRYFFAIALLAALARGHDVVLPMDTRRRAIMALATRGPIAAIFHDTSFGAPLKVEEVLAEGESKVERQSVDLASEGRVVLRGDSAEAEEAWSLSELLAQAVPLTDAFGYRTGMHVVSTVPPNQSYGLVLGVLGPLLSGGALSRTMFPDQSEIERESRHAEGALLVTAARHLRRLLRESETALGRYRHLVVSTPPALPGRLAQALSNRVTTTETVGTRRLAVAGTRSPSDPAGFRLLPGAMLIRDDQGRSRVVPARPGDVASDCGRLIEVRDDDRFEDLGTVGDLAEQGPDRVLLRPLEQRLMAVGGVQDAAVVSLRDPESNQLRVLAACVAPETLAPELTAHVRAALSGTAITHDLVCVDSLPVAEDGGCRRSDLLCLFGLDATGRPLNYELTWRAERTSDSEGVRCHAYEVEVPLDLAYFEGHFPDYPILPAAAQLGAIVLPALRRAQPGLGALTRMTRLKFLRRIRPGDVVFVELRIREESAFAEFSIRRDDKLCSAGRVELDRGAPS